MRFPSITIYRHSLSAHGKAYGPVIVIREALRKDHRLWLHEYEHVRQWWMSFGLHPILYTMSRRYRQWAEVRAYAIQAKPDGSDMDVMARRLASPTYRLGLGPEQALAILWVERLHMEERHG